MVAGQDESLEDDISLFRRTVGSVNPVSHDTVLDVKRKPAPWPSQRDRDDQDVLKALSDGLSDPEFPETGDELSFKQAGIQNRLFQKLRRGQLRIESELDLHGMTIAEAKMALVEFLRYAGNSGLRCVRIIHGKGKGSKSGIPVLKTRVNYWLKQKQEILAFCSARPVDGGTGAVYVLLKKTG